ncbi:uncharacterized protein JCM10292_001478 [Rhodotorula paludigena]|uniref:uncharacterized protein n=1 Tax=Rhodotorula paludigena TaxID=86838 RepID=UPI00317FAEF1
MLASTLLPLAAIAVSLTALPRIRAQSDVCFYEFYAWTANNSNATVQRGCASPSPCPADLPEAPLADDAQCIRLNDYYTLPCNGTAWDRVDANGTAVEWVCACEGDASQCAEASMSMATSEEHPLATKSLNSTSLPTSSSSAVSTTPPSSNSAAGEEGGAAATAVPNEGATEGGDGGNGVVGGHKGAVGGTTAAGIAAGLMAVFA